jgi:hypothetical protein
MTYTITVNQSANGKLSVVNTVANVAVNQYRTDEKRISNDTFVVSSANSAPAAPKRATKKRR